MWTNAPGLKRRLVFTGVKQTGIFVYLPNIGVLPNGISMITSGDLVGMAVFVEKTAGMQHPEEFVEMYNRHMVQAVLGDKESKLAQKDD